ncbi:L,D-transpeptidase family protein [Paracoccus alkenifer]|uniref:Murein L,D-transpeptidase YcbB/YkuD n=1 Tax=Paracoccus alkenifer TaxID=65735 RepID=A0A1H6K5Q2_9RHOB|nr:L,D-transpeptidase family protein [Paracoccus alkenifer]SEH67111.1 Murein L,D-transpeptidase YcbB/YkuD [Paracoccus alkenifer]
MMLSPLFRRSGQILLAVVAALAAGALSAVAGAPSPRLEFSPEEWRLARGVADDPGLAAWYGSTALQPVFAAPDSAPLRAALIAEAGQAGMHGLPDVYDVEHLRALDRNITQPHEIGTEIAFARSFARWVHDVGGGILDPRRVHPEIRRDVLRVPLERQLENFVHAADPVAALAAVAPRNPEYRALQAALAARTGPVIDPALPEIPTGVWREGARDPAIALMRARLAAAGLASDSPDPQLFDAELGRQLRAYQARAGLAPDGVAGPRTLDRLNGGKGADSRDLLIALERMRWMNGHDLNARMIWVNLPEFNVRVKDGGRTIYESRAVIGKDRDDWRTPEFSDVMQNVVVNPSWNVPRSMAIRDYLPRLQQNRFAAAHLDVVDSRGRVVDRASVDFSRYTAKSFPYRLRQKPSADNALGEVKFIFPNSMNIYLHDTPSKGLFGESVRAFSNGCIRVQKPVELAHVLLEGASADPAATYANARQSGAERFLRVTGQPVHLVYFTTTVDEDGTIRHFRDIYDRDPAVWRALQRAAAEGDSAGLETAALAQ